MDNGVASELWPNDLAQLFGYSSTSKVSRDHDLRLTLLLDDTAKRLLDDYELTYAHDDPTERLLNKFMAHIGVGFQMVPPQRRPPMQISSGLV